MEIALDTIPRVYAYIKYSLSSRNYGLGLSFVILVGTVKCLVS